MASLRPEEAASETVDSVHFSFYNDEEIRGISVKRITKPDLLDMKNYPVPDGLYDPSMGPLNEHDTCKTCGQKGILCPGHFGHIELERIIYNPLLFKSLQNLLQIICFDCGRLKGKVKTYISQLELLVRGDIVGATSLEDSEQEMEKSPEEDSASSDAVGGSESVLIDRKQDVWTSLQFEEVLSVLSKLMKGKRKKCQRCGGISPTISSPVFGWLYKATQDSDKRSNIIAAYNLDPDAAAQQSGNGDASQIDSELPSPEERSKGPKNRQVSDGSLKQMLSSGKKHLLPTEAENILKGLWKKEAKFCMLLCDIQQRTLSDSKRRRGYGMFFLKSLLVPPNKFRPPAGNSSRGVLEHPQNVLLSKVQEANIALHNCSPGDPNHMDTLRKWMDLQRGVNVLFDSSKGFVKSEKEANGIRQLLEKKTGILRQKMMGKRVNFACRSVISPDPYLAVNEIGIPPYFAVRLTYPERVTPWNAKKLRQAVINGADNHPGATHFKDKENTYRLQASANRYAISKKLLSSRGAAAEPGKAPESEFEGKVVLRHLQDGDIVLVNRQPTLHKPSMMAHVVRVLRGEKTIRMHYANCKAYNADFDGDEMNVHLPQDEISRAEAINIVNANKQYMGPASGEALRGLIQDHIVSAVLLTKKDTFLTVDEYHQLLYDSFVPASTSSSPLHGPDKKVSVIDSGNVAHTAYPAIMKPKPLWTGKQVITAILNHVTKGHPPFIIEQKGKIPQEYIEENPQGEIPGDLGNEKHVEADAQGKIPEDLNKKEDLSERVLYIHHNELIKGMIDKAQFGNYGIVHIVHELYGADTAGILLSVLSRLFTLFLQMHGFTCGVDDLLVRQESDAKRINILAGSKNLCDKQVVEKFGVNNNDPKQLQIKVEKYIRKKGESATISLDRAMCATLNEISNSVTKELFPKGLEKPFPVNCFSLMTITGAKGSSVNMTQVSSLLGQQMLEGKRVPRMVSGKTLPCFPAWDTSPRAGGFISDRFLTGLRPQEYYFHCMAGREGLIDTAVKTSRSGYLQRCLIKNLESLKVSYDYTVRDVDGSIVQFCYGEDGADVLKTSFLAKFRELSNNTGVVLDKLSYLKDEDDLSKSYEFIQEILGQHKEKVSSFVCCPEENKCYRCRIRNKEDPSKEKEILSQLLKVKYLSGLADPGESVGIVAAQCIGEPATQLTLNTFHLAGRGEQNVTLGIPRLQEILKDASDHIRTPLMKCQLLEDVSLKDAEKVAAKLRRIRVADIVESMEVCTVPFFISKKQISTIYKLRIRLFPHKSYPSPDLTIEECQSTLRTDFVDAMENAIEKHLDLLNSISDVKVTTRKEERDSINEVEEDESRSRATDGEDTVVSDADDENDDDLGTDAERRKRQVTDEMEYDDDIEKEKFVDRDDDDEPKSGLESEVESEDYAMGGEALDETDAEAPDSPNKSAVTSESDVLSETEKNNDKKGRKLRDKKKKGKTKGSSDGNIMENESENKQKAARKKKKRKWTILVKGNDLDFEVHYAFHKATPHILLAEIAQKTAKSLCVKKVTDIEQCSVIPVIPGTRPNGMYKEGDPIFLHTAGVNFEALWNLSDFLNIRELRSNDIHAMLKTYGVEVARTCIIEELRAVFKPYGIDVDFRHLSLIADFMTFHGGYRPMNRIGMGKFSTSPFSKMTFETATKFIVEAASHGEVDSLQSASAAVSLGQPPKSGTGSFSLMQKLDL